MYLLFSKPTTSTKDQFESEQTVVATLATLREILVCIEIKLQAITMFKHNQQHELRVIGN